MSGLKEILSTVKGFNPLQQVKEGAVDIVKDLAGKGMDLFSKVQDGKISAEQAKIDFEKFKIDAETQTENNITERWKADADGSWLKSNVRPLALCWALGNATLMIWSDSMKWIVIEDKWIPLLTQLLLTIVGGYFALRSIFDKNKTKK